MGGGERGGKDRKGSFGLWRKGEENGSRYKGWRGRYSGNDFYVVKAAFRGSAWWRENVLA